MKLNELSVNYFSYEIHHRIKDFFFVPSSVQQIFFLSISVTFVINNHDCSKWREGGEKRREMAMFNKFFVRPWCGARICPTVNDPRRPTTATLLPFFSRFRPSILETRRRRRGGMRAEYRLSSSHPRPNTVVAYTPWLSWFSLSVYNNITRVDQMPKPPSPKPQRYFNFFFLPIKSLHREAKIRENTELFLIFIALRKF